MVDLILHAVMAWFFTHCFKKNYEKDMDNVDSAGFTGGKLRTATSWRKTADTACSSGSSATANSTTGTLVSQ